MAPAKTATLADMAAQWERSAAGGHPGGHVDYDEQYDGSDGYDDDNDAAPTCACCRGDARLGSGPFQLARHKRGAGAGPGHSGSASRSRYPQTAPKRVLSASLREEFQQRLEERLAQDLGLPKSAARQSLQLCQRLLGICWSDDPAAGAGAQGTVDGDQGGAAGGGGGAAGGGAPAGASSTTGAVPPPAHHTAGAPPHPATVAWPTPWRCGLHQQLGRATGRGTWLLSTVLPQTWLGNPPGCCA
jgi:hypothetical protein